MTWTARGFNLCVAPSRRTEPGFRRRHRRCVEDLRARYEEVESVGTEYNFESEGEDEEERRVLKTRCKTGVL